MGEWIEIFSDITDFWLKDVSPFMGEWIEIPLIISFKSLTSSHPSWVSGLKDEPDLIKREVGFLHAFSQPFI
ncbi:Uncharacterised protein [Streptococcus pyogenes]|nr:Uncharacterised protein [Streptococcus pyogenes]